MLIIIYLHWETCPWIAKFVEPWMAIVGVIKHNSLPHSLLYPDIVVCYHSDDILGTRRKNDSFETRMFEPIYYYPVNMRH